MDAMDPPNPRRSILHLAGPSRHASRRRPSHDPLLHRSSSRLRSHVRHHPLHLPEITRDHIGSHRSRRELRVGFNSAGVLLDLEILDGNRAVSHGGDDRVLHSSRLAGSFSAVGEHVPSAVERRRKIHRGVLLRIGVD